MHATRLWLPDADLVASTVDGPEWTLVGDPMEAALVAAAGRLGVPVGIRSDYPRLAEVPFDTARRSMTTLHAEPSGGYLAVAKGAPEVILADQDPLRRNASDLSSAGRSPRRGCRNAPAR
jgi:P-type Ca2+ transporter type 2C